MERPHYHSILGIDRNASGAEVKRAFRRLARRFHPDVTDDPDGERKFKAVAEAYRMLKDRAPRGAGDRAKRHVPGDGELAATATALDVWFALFLWPSWNLFWLR